MGFWVGWFFILRHAHCVASLKLCCVAQVAAQLRLVFGSRIFRCHSNRLQTHYAPDPDSRASGVLKHTGFGVFAVLGGAYQALEIRERASL